MSVGLEGRLKLPSFWGSRNELNNYGKQIGCTAVDDDDAVT